MRTNNTRLTLKHSLMLEQLCCQIVYSYYYIDELFEHEWERRKAFVNWRIEILSFIASANSRDLSFILEYLQREDNTVYLEFNTLLTQHKTDQLVNYNSKNVDEISIINCIRSLLCKTNIKSKEIIVVVKGE